MAMRVGFVPNSEENIMQFVDGLRISIKKKINVEKMQSLEKDYHLDLRIEEGKLKRKHGSRQRDERENEILLNVVAMSVDCASEVHVVEEIDEGSVDEIHVMNNMLRESAKESFSIEECNEEIAGNEFGQQTQEVAVNDVVAVDNAASLSGVVENSDLVTTGLQERDVIVVEMIHPMKDNCNSGK